MLFILFAPKVETLNHLFGGVKNFTFKATRRKVKNHHCGYYANGMQLDIAFACATRNNWKLEFSFSFAPSLCCVELLFWLFIDFMNIHSSNLAKINVNVSCSPILAVQYAATVHIESIRHIFWPSDICRSSWIYLVWKNLSRKFIHIKENQFSTYLPIVWSKANW